MTLTDLILSYLRDYGPTHTEVLMWFCEEQYSGWKMSTNAQKWDEFNTSINGVLVRQEAKVRFFEEGDSVLYLC